ncbi:hypothetical protein CcNV_010 [Crangon crangon nudivirus]|uniref:Uncharacterized protein n=1 Tax=Crangon crangon nudivirus TaxID=2880838 RepID=A0AAE8Y204_9VIRU|nr:hypothetical protein QKT25_gp010 [Crangon crangon nudivirus]UBZ25494.1 hypothetical protein CcNV_010 [Crangon crangon nudivirus]
MSSSVNSQSEFSAPPTAKRMAEANYATEPPAKRPLLTSVPVLTPMNECIAIDEGLTDELLNSLDKDDSSLTYCNMMSKDFNNIVSKDDFINNSHLNQVEHATNECEKFNVTMHNFKNHIDKTIGINSTRMITTLEGQIETPADPLCKRPTHIYKSHIYIVFYAILKRMYRAMLTTDQQALGVLIDNTLALLVAHKHKAYLAFNNLKKVLKNANVPKMMSTNDPIDICKVFGIPSIESAEASSDTPSVQADSFFGSHYDTIKEQIIPFLSLGELLKNIGTSDVVQFSKLGKSSWPVMEGGPSIPCLQLYLTTPILVPITTKNLTGREVSIMEVQQAEGDKIIKSIQESLRFYAFGSTQSVDLPFYSINVGSSKNGVQIYSPLLSNEQEGDYSMETDQFTIKTLSKNDNVYIVIDSIKLNLDDNRNTVSLKVYPRHNANPETPKKDKICMISFTGTQEVEKLIRQ